MTDALLDLGDEKYVLLTTFRRTGAGVGTAVWIARAGEELVVTTSGASGKAKRLRNSGRVTLVPCDRAGRVADGATPIEAHAVLQEHALEPYEEALHAKYGAMYTAMKLGTKLSRKKLGESVIIRISAIASAA